MNLFLPCVAMNFNDCEYPYAAMHLSVQLVNTLVRIIMTHFNIACIDESSLTTIKSWNSIEHYAIMIICRRIEESVHLNKFKSYSL